MKERDIIIRPLLSEKSYADIATKKYVFIVDKKANKTEIKLFGSRRSDRIGVAQEREKEAFKKVAIESAFGSEVYGAAHNNSIGVEQLFKYGGKIIFERTSAHAVRVEQFAFEAAEAAGEIQFRQVDKTGFCSGRFCSFKDAFQEFCSVSIFARAAVDCEYFCHDFLPRFVFVDEFEALAAVSVDNAARLQK